MNNKAMALVEIIVSMLVLAVAALAVTSTMSLVSSGKLRSAGGGSLDLQAASYARETLEGLKNAVSTNAAVNGPLIDDTHGAGCAAAAGVACGAGKEYTPAGAGLNANGLPTTSDLVTKATGASSRKYKVWDISDGNGGVAYKKVTVYVNWND